MPGAVEMLERGLACHQAGRLEEAEAIYQSVLKEEPANADAHHLLGLVASHQGRYQLAEERIREAIALNPLAPFYHNNLGNVLQALGRFQEAVVSYRDALRLDPAYVEPHSNLGPALDALGRHAEAVAAGLEAVRRRPGWAEAYMNLGNSLAKLNRYEEAEAAYREAARLRPGYAEAYSNLGNAVLEQGRVEEAAGCFEEALQLDPANGVAHWNRGWLRLLQGDYERGWQEYEWRWVTGNAAPRSFRQPVWDGSCLWGATILLHAEQGLGDTVQFIRYAPWVKQAAGRVVVECQARLAPLVATVSGVDEVVPAGAELPPFDTHAGLLSLPRIFGTRVETVPAAVPYFTVAPERLERWRARLAGVRGFKVGLVWAGSPTHKNDRSRSLPLSALAPLAEAPGVAWFSLQRGPQAAELRAARLPITNLEEDDNDAMDTAAIIMNLDLVIAADTMVAHLAGALARPVWTLLAYMPDFRWMLGREDTPWYPTMRLFRQPRPGDWAAVIERVREELGHAASG